jgi:hypothetical protein
MNFNMKSPCKDCPFVEGSSTNTTLMPGRIEGIANDLMRGATFECHKTLNLSSNKKEHCGGALQYLERENRPNQMMRIAERFGGYDRHQLIPCDNLIESFH